MWNSPLCFFSCQFLQSGNSQRSVCFFWKHQNCLSLHATKAKTFSLNLSEHSVCSIVHTVALVLTHFKCLLKVRCIQHILYVHGAVVSSFLWKVADDVLGKEWQITTFMCWWGGSASWTSLFCWTYFFTFLAHSYVFKEITSYKYVYYTYQGFPVLLPLEGAITVKWNVFSPYISFLIYFCRFTLSICSTFPKWWIHCSSKKHFPKKVTVIFTQFFFHSCCTCYAFMWHIFFFCLF